MTATQSRFSVIAFVLLAVAVAIGAMGSHMLKPKLTPEDVRAYETANFYHFIHGLGMLLLLAFSRRMSTKMLNASLLCMLLGIVLFCGSLYIIATSTFLFGSRWGFLGIVTPFGGILFIVAWLIAASNAGHKRNGGEHKSEKR